MAAEWFRKAAEQGDASAQFNLGVLYANGTGLQQDAVQAYKWLSLAVAAVSGGEAARYAGARDTVRTALTPEQIADAERLTREWAASHVRRP